MERIKRKKSDPHLTFFASASLEDSKFALFYIVGRVLLISGIIVLGNGDIRRRCPYYYKGAGEPI